MRARSRTTRESTGRLRLLAGAALLLLAVAAASWWLLGGAAATPTSPVPHRWARADESLSSTVVPEPLATREVRQRPLTAPQPAAAAPPVEQQREEEPPARPGVPVTITGRVVDHLGAPLAGARVTYVPNDRTLRAWQLGSRRSLGPRSTFGSFTADPRSLPHVQTGEDGRFVLSSANVLPRFDEESMFSWNEALDVVVEHEDFAVRAVSCGEFREGEHDLGDVAVEPGGGLAGRVVDEEGAPLPGVEVSTHMGVERRVLTGPFHRGPIDAFPRAVSGEDGEYRVVGLWAGTTRLSFTAPGRAPASVSGRVEPGQVQRLDDVVLTLGGTIAGTVVDERGEPVAGARVKAVGRDAVPPGGDAPAHALTRGPHGEAVSDERGAFAITGLRQPFYDVTAEAEGHDVGLLAAVEPDASPVRLRLLPAAVLQVTVAPPAGGALPEVLEVVASRLVQPAEASVRGRAPWPLPQLSATGAATGERGFVFGPLGPLGTRLVVSADGYASEERLLPGAAPGEIVALTVELAPPAALGGSVLAEDGAVLAGAVVTLAREPSPPGAKPLERECDEDGRFAFDGLAPGTWTLSGKALGHLSSESRVELEAGERRELDLVLARGAVVQGTVRTVADAPVADAQITIFADDFYGTWDFIRTATTDDEGRYRLAGLPAGTFSLGASWGGHESITIDLQPPEVREHHFVARSPPVVRGIVLHAGRAVPNATVHQVVDAVNTADGSVVPMAMEFARTDEQGRFDAATYRGKIELFAEHEGKVTTPVPLTLAWDDVHEVELHVGSESLALRFVAADTGEGVPGVRARLEFRKGAWSRHTHTGDADGLLQAQGLAAGSYTVRAFDTGSFLAPPYGSLVVVVGESEDEIVVPLERGAVLRGGVRTPAGRSLDVGLSLEPADGGESVADTHTRQGKYAFGAVRPGVYRIKTRRGALEGGGQLVSLTTPGEHHLDLVVDG